MTKTKKPVKKSPAPPNPVGHPTDYDPSFHIQDFLAMSRQGKSITQIAAKWDVCRATIYNWSEKHSEFLDAVVKGKEFSEAWFENTAQSAMIGKLKINGEDIELDVRLFELVTRNRFGWGKDSKLEISGKDGGPVQINTFVDLVNQLEAEEEKRKKKKSEAES